MERTVDTKYASPSSRVVAPGLPSLQDLLLDEVLYEYLHRRSLYSPRLCMNNVIAGVTTIRSII